MGRAGSRYGMTFLLFQEQSWDDREAISEDDGAAEKFLGKFPIPKQG